MKQPLAPPSEIAWYQVEWDQVCELLATDNNGLTTTEAKARLEKCGYNELQVERRSPLIRFLCQFHNVLLYILMVAAVATFFLGDFMDMYVIIGVVLGSAGGVISAIGLTMGYEWSYMFLVF